MYQGQNTCYNIFLKLANYRNSLKYFKLLVQERLVKTK